MVPETIREGPPGALRRYSSVAIALHWIIAAGIAVQIGLGWYMGDLEDHSPAQRSMEGLHISLGLTILVLTVMRVIWRLVHRPPPFLSTVAAWERWTSRAVHVLFYVMLLALPLSGWVMESFGPRPIPFWGAAWPHFPGLPLKGVDAREIKGTIEELHGSPMVWTMIVLVALHVAGAVKHQFDGRPVLWRMIPGLKRPGAA